jgi:hypothetical protein
MKHPYVTLKHLEASRLRLMLALGFSMLVLACSSVDKTALNGPQWAPIQTDSDARVVHSIKKNSIVVNKNGSVSFTDRRFVADKNINELRLIDPSLATSVALVEGDWVIHCAQKNLILKNIRFFDEDNIMKKSLTVNQSQAVLLNTPGYRQYQYLCLYKG